MSSAMPQAHRTVGERRTEARTTPFKAWNRRGAMRCAELAAGAVPTPWSGLRRLGLRGPGRKMGGVEILIDTRDAPVLDGTDQAHPAMYLRPIGRGTANHMLFDEAGIGAVPYDLLVPQVGDRVQNPPHAGDAFVAALLSAVAVVPDNTVRAVDRSESFGVT